MNESTYDVVVVGGGAAGLSGAITLARSRRKVLVLDSGTPRNAPADGVHNFLGNEGLPPLDLLAKGRDEVASYGGEFHCGVAVVAERTDSGFTVTLEDGSTVGAKRLLITTGLIDQLPEVDGIAEMWGHAVLHCPYCHGWRCATRRSGSSRPVHSRCTRRCCGAS